MAVRLPLKSIWARSPTRPSLEVQALRLLVVSPAALSCFWGSSTHPDLANLLVASTNSQAPEWQEMAAVYLKTPSFHAQ